VVQEEAKAASFEVGVVAIEVVAAKLVDDDDDYELRMAVVGAVCDGGGGGFRLGPGAGESGWSRQGKGAGGEQGGGAGEEVLAGHDSHLAGAF
jgi:hypothetical protein